MQNSNNMFFPGREGRKGHGRGERRCEDRHEHRGHRGGPMGEPEMMGPRGPRGGRPMKGDFDEFGPMGPRGGRRAGRGPRGEGRGRGRRGEVRNALLALLVEGEPMNGYQLIKAIEEKSGGLWTPGAGSVYPALGLLVDEGLLAVDETDGKKAYTLSDEGRTWVSEHGDAVADPWDRVTGPDKGQLDVRREMHQLGMALKQVGMAGTPEQAEKAAKVVEAARKELYKILAED